MPTPNAKKRGRRVSRPAPAVRRSNRTVERVPGARIGWLLPESRPDRLIVDFAGSGRTKGVRARTTVRLTAAEWKDAAMNRRSVLLVSDDDHGEPRPVIVGFVYDDGDIDRGMPSIDARVDGIAVRIEGRKQVEIRCGKASLVLTRDGRIILSGVEVDTRASGTNRVRGGIVKIN
jgi:hypothetical protein